MVKDGEVGAGWRGANGGEIEDICNSVKTKKQLIDTKNRLVVARGSRW